MVLRNAGEVLRHVKCPAGMAGPDRERGLRPRHRLGLRRGVPRMPERMLPPMPIRSAIVTECTSRRTVVAPPAGVRAIPMPRLRPVMPVMARRGVASARLLGVPRRGAMRATVGRRMRRRAREALASGTFVCLGGERNCREQRRCSDSDHQSFHGHLLSWRDTPRSARHVRNKMPDAGATWTICCKRPLRSRAAENLSYKEARPGTRDSIYTRCSGSSSQRSTVSPTSICTVA